MLFVSLASGCSSHPPPAKDNGNPDDIVTAPGGPVYKANVQQKGVANPWLPIRTKELILGDNISVTYRADIETKAGQTRNIIVYFRTPGQNITDIQLDASNIPVGMQITSGMLWNGPPGTIAQVLQVEVSKDMKPGQYSLEIDVNLNGIDYGRIPGTVTIMQ